MCRVEPPSHLQSRKRPLLRVEAAPSALLRTVASLQTSRPIQEGTHSQQCRLAGLAPQRHTAANCQRDEDFSCCEWVSQNSVAWGLMSIQPYTYGSLLLEFCVFISVLCFENMRHGVQHMVRMCLF